MASTITIICPECEKLLKVPSQAEGKKVRCSACDATFIALVEVDEEEIEVVEEVRPVKSNKAKPTRPAPPDKVKAKAPAKTSAKAPAKAKNTANSDPFTPDNTPFGLVDEYLGRRCPDCANAIGEDDRICLHCGYDTVSREKARTRKVQHITGFDIFLWLLPGILCALIALATIGATIWMCVTINEEYFGDVWYSFLGHVGMKVYGVAIGLFIVYKTGRFAINRLILNPKPPEIELKMESNVK